MSILLSAFLAASATASGPSFDCSRAASAAERTICTDPRLAEADRDLALIHARAIRKAGLKREQLAWIAERDRCANAGCIAASYEWRTIGLMDRIDMPLNYERRDHANAPASLAMAPLGDGRHLFRLTALYIYPGGMNANDSLVGGVVRISGDRGVWRDSEGCSLSFVRKGRGWIVGQGETCRNGLNVTMGGHYRRRS